MTRAPTSTSNTCGTACKPSRWRSSGLVAGCPCAIGRSPVVGAQGKELTAFVTGNAPYVRGAAVLNTLRMQLGDKHWRAAIRHFVRTRSGQASYTEHLRQSVQAVSGQRLDWFFEQWIYKAGHPVFDVSHEWDSAARQLRLRVRQAAPHNADEAAARVDYFQGAVDVEIDDQVHRVWLAPKPENEFSFSLARAPGHVHFDRGDAWIKTLRFDKPTAELMHQFAHTRDAAGRQWAMRAAPSWPCRPWLTSPQHAGRWPRRCGTSAWQQPKHW